jgi:CRISPR-associated protein Csd2
MFEHDRSAARGEMTARGLIVFKHASALGNAAAHSLFDRVKVGRSAGDDIRLPGDPRIDNMPPARRFEDYGIRVDDANMPGGIEMLQML